MPNLHKLAALSGLDCPSFVRAIGAVFEHSPWVAERAWSARPFPTRESLDAALESALLSAGHDLQRSLICAHPELAGRAAVRGELTAHSAQEQRTAGLDACSQDEYEAILQLNRRYREKFGWPFIVAVKGLSRSQIISEMARRVERSPEDEFAEALSQILRIASIRLDALLENDCA